MLSSISGSRANTLWVSIKEVRRGRALMSKGAISWLSTGGPSISYQVKIAPNDRPLVAVIRVPQAQMQPEDAT